MSRFVVLALVGLVHCATRTPEAIPSVVASAAPTPPRATAVEPQAPTAEPPPAPAPTPPLVQTDLGWVRSADDPAAPLLQLREIDHGGATGAAGVQAIVDAIEPLLVCWESAARDQRVDFHIRASLSDAPDSDPLTVEVQAEGRDALRTCIDRTLRAVIPRPAAGEWLRASFILFPRQDGATLRRARNDAIVSVREAGTCWQWQDYPCAPHKRCMADEYVRTTCGEASMRDDVRLQFGLVSTRPSERATPTDLRLVGGKGDIAWRVALPDDVVARYGARFVSDGSNAVDADDQPGVIAVEYGLEQIIVADTTGLRVLDRQTGALTFSWNAPPQTAISLWYDSGSFTLERGRDTCTGTSHGARFLAHCGRHLALFDSQTFAVFSTDPLAHVGSMQIDDRRAVVRNAGLVVHASLRAAGVKLKLEGQVFVH